MMDNRLKQLKELFQLAGQTHHQVFKKENGEDPDWPTWYADWLLSHTHFSALAPKAQTRSDLTWFLVTIDREFSANYPDQSNWTEYYARRALEHFRE